jgi:hypothetical protein
MLCWLPTSSTFLLGVEYTMYENVLLALRIYAVLSKFRETSFETLEFLNLNFFYVDVDGRKWWVSV